MASKNNQEDTPMIEHQDAYDRDNAIGWTDLERVERVIEYEDTKDDSNESNN